MFVFWGAHCTSRRGIGEVLICDGADEAAIMASPACAQTAVDLMHKLDGPGIMVHGLEDFDERLDDGWSAHLAVLYFYGKHRRHPRFALVFVGVASGLESAVRKIVPPNILPAELNLTDTSCAVWVTRSNTFKVLESDHHAEQPDTE